MLRNQDGSGEPRRFKLTGAATTTRPGWSPRATRLAFVDNSGTLFYFDIATGEQHKVATDPHFDSGGVWTTAGRPTAAGSCTLAAAPRDYRQLYLYSLDGDRSYPVTDGLADVGQPTFDAGGKYLYFRISTNSGPTNAGFDMSSFGLRQTDSIYLAVLARAGASPLAPQSDEEKGAKGSETASAATPVPQSSRPPTGTVTIDVQDLQQRMIPLPIDRAMYDQVAAGADGKVYYLRINPGSSPFGRPTGRLMRYDLSARKEDQLLDGAQGFAISNDGSKILALSGGSWQVLDATGPDHPESKTLKLDAVQIRVEPRAEWQEMYEDAWRINQDFFYDPNMNGVDWNAMREKYAQFLPDLATRSDLNRLIAWLFSELRVSHHEVYRRRHPRRGGSDSSGLSGGRLHHGQWALSLRQGLRRLRWYPDVRAPLAQPGAEVKEGEYLLAVNGRALTSDESIYRRFENTVDKVTEITVGEDPGGQSSRTITVLPIGGEDSLRQIDWIESEPNQGGPGVGRTHRLRQRSRHKHRRLRLLQPILLSAIGQSGHHRGRPLQSRRRVRRLRHRPVAAPAGGLVHAAVRRDLGGPRAPTSQDRR